MKRFKDMEFVVDENPLAKDARVIMDRLVNDALMKHTETHLMVFGFPYDNWERIFDDAVAAGYYNGKTVTFKTPKGTITFHAEVGAPND